MIRYCPKRDARCPHGMGCQYWIDRYHCKEEPDAKPATQPSAAQIAYACLWRMMPSGDELTAARRKLLAEIGGQGSDGQREAIQWALDNLPHVTTSEIIALDF